MRYSSRITLTTASLVTLAIVAGFATHSVLARWVSDISSRVLTPIAQRIGYGQAVIAVLTGRGDVIQENIKLRAELTRAQATVTQFDTLTRENEFLRAAAGLRELTGMSPIEANIFGYIRDGGLREMVVNKGQADYISIGDVVVTAQGALVGIVKDVSERHSIVRAISDPSFEVTARVVGTDIVGLLHVDVNGVLMLDMIQKAEKVSEGQSIATSGNDGLPAGILIGAVRSVDVESTTLFKVVRVSSAVAKDFSGKVIIF